MARICRVDLNGLNADDFAAQAAIAEDQAAWACLRRLRGRGEAAALAGVPA